MDYNFIYNFSHILCESIFNTVLPIENYVKNVNGNFMNCTFVIKLSKKVDINAFVFLRTPHVKYNTIQYFFAYLRNNIFLFNKTHDFQSRFFMVLFVIYHREFS